MMKRLALKLSLLVAAGGALALTFGMFSLSSASASGPTVGVDSFSGQVGAVSKVNMTVADIPEPGAGAWTIDLTFDPDVVTGVACTPSQGGSVCNAQFDSGQVRVVGTNIYGLAGDATLASIGLACKAPGETALTLSLSVFVNATPGDPQDIDAKIANGTAVCSDEPVPTTEPPPTPTPPDSGSKVPGDANCDGQVNALDAVLVLQYTIGVVNSVCPDADYNHDGVVNALDAALILQKDAGLI